MEWSEGQNFRGGRRWYWALESHPGFEQLSSKGAIVALIIGNTVGEKHDWFRMDQGRMGRMLKMGDRTRKRCRYAIDGLEELAEAGFIVPSDSESGTWHLAMPAPSSASCKLQVAETGDEVGPHRSKLLEQVGPDRSKLDSTGPGLDLTGPNWTSQVQPYKEVMGTYGDLDGDSQTRVSRKTIDRMVEIFGGYMRGSTSAQRAIGLAVFAIRQRGAVADPEAWLIERAEAYIAATDPAYIRKLENWLDDQGYDANPERPAVAKSAGPGRDDDEAVAQFLMGGKR